MYFLLKVLISALIIAAASEVARRDAPLAAILASLPLTSLLAILWLYHDTRNGHLAGELATHIFWAILPSLLFFVAFPWLLKTGLRFSLSLLLSVGIMVVGYTIYAAIIRRLGVTF
ncbi:MAG TPA: DUF3147 family protein [Desulfuromonadales bacterium]|nr:DUF3147 family protein [Desulfuromonadales bacterium]